MPYLYGRRRNDGLWSPARKPDEPAARRCRSDRHLCCIHHRYPARLHSAGGCRYRHHRRRGRPDRHIPCIKACSSPARSHSRCGIFVYGSYSYNSAPDHEAAHHKERARGRDEAAQNRQQDREDNLPRRRACHLRFHTSLRRSAYRHVHARQPVQRERRC